MTLVDDHEIKEIGGKLFVDVLLLICAGDCLIQTKVDFKGFIHGAVSHLRHGFAEGLEVVSFCLVGEDIAIYQEKNSLLGSGFPKTPDDLKSGVGLARASRHH